MEVLFGISLTINLIVLGVILFVCLYSRKVKKRNNEILKEVKFFGKENVVDEEKFQDFFGNN